MNISENKIKKVIIVSLSRGIIGEPFVRHEVEIGLKRLEAYGIEVYFSEHALCGLDYIEKHPEKRAEDLIDAFNSDADMILCAVGGDDTYRLLPYLFDHDELKNAVSDKVFLGFSDSTVNHFMLHKVGLNTFYGQAFLPDICELHNEMLPYTAGYFEELIRTGTVSEIIPSKIWYDSREDFSPSAIGTVTASHLNEGFVLLQGSPVLEGEVFGGCIDTIYDMFSNERYADSAELCSRYGLFPELDEWKGKILLLESSEEKASPEKYRKMLEILKKQGIFDVINGVLVGKPADETFFDEYETILREVINNQNLPVVFNINVGHALPRCIIPFGIPAKVDIINQKIVFG